MQRLKISREGIILIKSFEGFRPRAERRHDGRWVIGYGHTLSAREGASVSEGDAELLLQYDLLPVARAINDEVAGRVNQHQFDALASFAYSIGLNRFIASDVLSRLNAGSAAQAADAMVGWPTAAPPVDAGLRRRVAERALFVADPGRPVALADLLSAPLSPEPLPSVPATLATPVLEAPAEATTDVTAAEPVLPASSFATTADNAASRLVETGALPTMDPSDAVTSAIHQPVDANDGLVESASAPILRHEPLPDTPPRRLVWREWGVFLLVSGFGLVSLGLSMAAFRRSTQFAGSTELSIIASVLALLGVGCVCVAAYNLYRRRARYERKSRG